MPSYRTIDDAGKPVRARWSWLVPLRGQAAVHTDAECPADPTRAQSSVQSLRSLWHIVPEYFIPPGVFLVVFAAWLLLVWTQGALVLAVTLFSPISSSLIFAIIATGLWTLRCLSRHAVRCREAVLHRGRCPGCTYELGSLSPSPAGLTTCPECGSSWNRAGRASVPEVIRVASQPKDLEAPDSRAQDLPSRGLPSESPV